MLTAAGKIINPPVNISLTNARLGRPSPYCPCYIVKNRDYLGSVESRSGTSM